VSRYPLRRPRLGQANHSRRKIRSSGCDGCVIWRLVAGPVAQCVPKMRTTEANKTVANAAISVCANVHIRIAFEAMISGISTAARRERPILEDILTPLAMPSTQLSTSSSLGCVAISLVVPTIVGAGDGSDGPGATGAGRLTGAALTPNCICASISGDVVVTQTVRRKFSLPAKTTVE
jgi:hypothetical protein